MTRERPLRVLQLTDFYPPVSGGLERVVHDLSAGLAEREVEVAVATLTPRPQQTPGVTCHVLRSATAALPGGHADPTRPFHPTLPDPLTRRDLDALVARLRPDVVHAHSWVLNSWLPLRRRHPGVATVVYAHDYGTFCVKKTNVRGGRTGRCDEPSLGRCIRCAREQYGLVKSAGLTTALSAMRRSASSVDQVVAVSSWVAQSLATGLRIAAPRVIPPAVRLPGRDPLPRPDFLPDSPFVLYVGQLSAHKGVDVLAEAMAGLPELPLVMLGIAQPGRRPVPQRAGVVTRLDVAHHEVMAAWQHASVGVVPSLWGDPMPLVALEAMSQGCPIVVSAIGGLLDSVADGVTGVHVPPGEVGALRTAIGGLVRDEGRRREMSRAARLRSRRFDIDKVVEQWMATYRELPATAPVAMPG